MRARAAALAALLAVASLMLLLAACGSSGEPEAAPAEPPAETAAPPAGTQPAAPAETAAAAPAGCTAEEFEDQGADHVTEPPPGFEYNSFPPTSGPHGPAPAVWNLYVNPVPQLALIHNLEHGGVVVQIGQAVPQETLKAIIDWYVGSPAGIVVAPLPELGGDVALTAWRYLLTCDGFDEAAFTSFRDDHRFKGPERIPPALMEPGQA